LQFRSCRNSWYSAFSSFFQDDAVDVCVHGVQAFGFFEVRAVDLGVVLQLSRLLDAVVERLSLGPVSVPSARFEQIATLLGQRNGSRVAVKADGLDEP
jgi:hypothetical protein